MNHTLSLGVRIQCNVHEKMRAKCSMHAGEVALASHYWVTRAAYTTYKSYAKSGTREMWPIGRPDANAPKVWKRILSIAYSRPSFLRLR